MTERPSFLHRWYDQDMHVSELVAIMEGLSDESQYLLALLLGAIAEEIIANKGKSQFVKELDWDKLISLMKSKRGRRWYDEEPEMHKAFNLLFSLDDADKGAVGRQLYVPALIIQAYERYCKAKQHPVDLDVICDIVEVSFREGAQAAESKFAHFNNH